VKTRGVWILVFRVVHNFVVLFDCTEEKKKKKRKNPPNKDPPLTLPRLQSCPQQTQSSTNSEAQAPNLDDAREAFPTAPRLTLSEQFESCASINPLPLARSPISPVHPPIAACANQSSLTPQRTVQSALLLGFTWFANPQCCTFAVGANCWRLFHHLF